MLHVMLKSGGVIEKMRLNVIPIVRKPPKPVPVVNQIIIRHVFGLRATLKASTRKSEVVTETWDNVCNRLLGFKHSFDICQKQPVLANKDVIDVDLNMSEIKKKY